MGVLLHFCAIGRIVAVPTYIWMLILSFSLTAVTTAATETFYTIFVMKRFDEKFRDAPSAAYELALFGDAIMALIGLLLFGGALALSARRTLYPDWF